MSTITNIATNTNILTTMNIPMNIPMIMHMHMHMYMHTIMIIPMAMLVGKSFLSAITSPERKSLPRSQS
jgi:hypothetical protein